MRHSVCFIVGARTNFIKTTPVYHAPRSASSAELLLVHTGLHDDDEMSEIFVQDLGLPQPDFFLAVGSGTHEAPA